MNKIRVLQLGKEDWNQVYPLPEHIELVYGSEDEAAITGLFDLVILDTDIRHDMYEKLMRCTRAHCLYATENAKMTRYTEQIYAAKAGMRLYTGDLDAFWKDVAINYYPEPYGEKFSNSLLMVNPEFKGEIEFSGGHDLSLYGDFGEDFHQIAYWKNNIPVFEDQCIDLYFEHEKSEEVEVKLVLHQFYNGSVHDFQQKWEFSGSDLQGIVRMDNRMHTGPVFASILAKGKGTLKIIALHDRYSRRDYGFFLPGGERYVTSKGEEIFCYYDPGDLKPPLSFYFSGYRKQEGFEGYYMMRKMGCPFVLVTDPRLEGGAFYVGDEEYEKLFVDILKGYMKKAGVLPSQVIFSGNSMGTFGSLYYACDIKPHALILGKPLTNMGDVATNERIHRAGVFPTSLDVLLKNYGDITDENAKLFNERFWKKFDHTNWSHTKFIVSYLYEDDYDPNGYGDILSHLSAEGGQVYGRGIHGRHNDNTAMIIEWFKSQYNKILREDFDRRNNI